MSSAWADRSYTCLLHPAREATSNMPLPQTNDPERLIGEATAAPAPKLALPHATCQALASVPPHATVPGGNGPLCELLDNRRQHYGEVGWGPCGRALCGRGSRGDPWLIARS